MTCCFWWAESSLNRILIFLRRPESPAFLIQAPQWMKSLNSSAKTLSHAVCPQPAKLVYFHFNFRKTGLTAPSTIRLIGRERCFHETSDPGYCGACIRPYYRAGFQIQRQECHDPQ